LFELHPLTDQLPPSLEQHPPSLVKIPRQNNKKFLRRYTGRRYNGRGILVIKYFLKRILSAIVLFGSIGIFIYHSSIYVSRFIDKRNSIQMYTTKVQNITVPDIIICPVRQFRYLIKYCWFPEN